MKKVLFAVAVAALGIVVPAGTATAAESPCVGALSGTHDNVRVPANADCVLTNAQVRNSVRVDENGRIQTDNVQIGNSFELKQPRGPINILNTEIGSNLEIKGLRTTMAPMPSRICSTDIGGNLRISDMNFNVPPGPGLAVGTTDQCLTPLGSNNIEGNVSATNNRGVPFSVRFGQNNIGGNLDCRDNQPPATNEGNNVGGNESGECGD